MKKSLPIQLLLIIISISSFAYAQQAGNAEEKNKHIATLESEIIKQKEEITYLKTTLKLLSASIEAEAEEISFKINGVRGNINQQKIFVEGIIENKGAKRAIQAADANLFDPQGNSHKAYQITFGDETRLELQPDIPVKFKIEFTDIREQPPVIKAIVLKVYRRAMPGRTEDVIFKNLAVHWK